ncbi:toxin-antitoxin system YwqK family antitoxin [Psychromonas hadalis]|uniref:toxin-antitoxin system YwqK family antitoxin n=1 Tax=Psychromonas hadalis TaxID=211669 RepID=UPI0003B3F359|nr:toxin-antitoxin system YwqK family antitoxin [Psychromonas hadalis]
MGIITYKDNVKVSKESFTYYQTGELSIQTTFVNGLKSGTVKYYSKNSDVWHTEQYLHGKKHGFSISYYSPKSMAKKGHFSHGLIEGVQEAFLRDGKRSDKWLYKQGKRLSHFKFQYFKNGHLQYLHSYQNGKKNGLSNTYNESGQLLISTNYKHNLRHGKTLQFYKNGHIKSEKRYQENLQHGGSSGYFLTGALQWQSHYHSGLREGIYKEYYQNGQLKKQISYHGDQQNGPKRFFHENGFLKYELTMKNSKAEWLIKRV